MITGRVGVISLCQLSFAIIGAWTVGWCNVQRIPGGFSVWMIVGGLAAVPAGLLIGLPALRLRGVNLAITTFSFATAVDIVFSSKQFPGADSFATVARPAGFTGDSGYFRFAVIVVALIFAGLAFLDRTRLGASWIELRYSERGAAAHGINVARSKLAAFAVSAFIAGIAGGLMVGQVGSTTPAGFSAQASLTYFAIAVTIGVRYWDAAAMAGLLGALMPVLLDKIHIPQDYTSVVFGILAVLAIAQGKGQMGQSEIIRARRQARKARAAAFERSDAPGEQGVAAPRRSSASRLVGKIVGKIVGVDWAPPRARLLTRLWARPSMIGTALRLAGARAPGRPLLTTRRHGPIPGACRRGDQGPHRQVRGGGRGRSR